MTEVFIVFRCGCRESWSVSQLPAGESDVLKSEEVCPLESCQTCTHYGRACAERLAMQESGKAAEFKDIAPMPRRRYSRMKWK